MCSIRPLLGGGCVLSKASVHIQIHNSRILTHSHKLKIQLLKRGLYGGTCFPFPLQNQN